MICDRWCADVEVDCDVGISIAWQSDEQLSELKREVHELRSKLEEDGEDMQETMRKYKTLISQQSDEKSMLVEAQGSAEQLKQEKAALDDKVSDGSGISA